MEAKPSPKDRRLSAKAVAVLEMIAAGRTYEQILAHYPDLTYRDIFDAAAEALGPTPRESAMHRAKARHARAYEPWSPEEEADLRRMLGEGQTVARIAGTLQRQRSAIRSRILRLDLMQLLTKGEQARFDNEKQSRPAAHDFGDCPVPPG